MPSRPERILIAVVGHPDDDDPLALGLLLAEACDADVTLACAYGLEPESARVLDAEGVSPRGAAFQILREIRERVERPVAITAGAAAVAADGLEALAVDHDADLVVLGSSHRGRLGRALLGSTAEQLIQRLRRPVAVAPRGYGERAPRRMERIGVAWSDQATSARALIWADALAERLGVDAELIHVEPPPPVVEPAASVGGLHRVLAAEREKEQAALAAETGAVGRHFTATLREGDPGHLLRDVSWRLDLLVLGARARPRRESIGDPSLSHRLLESADCPLVLVPPPD